MWMHLAGLSLLGPAWGGLLAWLGVAWLCMGWPSGVALPGMASPGVALPVVVLCWCPFLVEHRRWIIHLMEFQLEFLLDHMLVVSFWYVLLVEPSHAICMKAR